MRKLGEGDKSEVFVLDDERIVKLFFPHYASLAEEEAEYSRVLQRAGVEAPRVDEMIEVDGRPGIVWANLEAGETLSRAVRARPWKILPEARALADLHALVHDCEAPDLPSQRTRLDEQIRTSAVLSEGARFLALERLRSLPDGAVVCHNDVHMLNLIAGPSGLRLIDWVLATRGNPLADVATAVLQLRFGDLPRGRAARWSLEIGRALFSSAYLRRYQQLRPGSREEVKQWELPAAAALTERREGTMLRQLLARIETLMERERAR